MFRNNYQGGAVVEIFSGQGKDPVAKWKLSGGPCAIHKEYNKEVKGFVYCLEGSSQTVKMQIPQNGKLSLGLLQRFLVLQVNIPQCKDFSIELVITDSEHLKRRLHLSTVHKELSATLFHAKIPFVGLKRNIWCTLCIDLVSFTAELFKGFLTLDGITLFATCKVRRIFTMKAEPTADDMFLNGSGLVDLIPRSCQFSPDVSHVTQMLNMENVRMADMRTAPVNSDCVPDQSAAVRSSSYRRARPQANSHTASGSRASGPPLQTGKAGSTASDGMESSLFITNTGTTSIRMKQKGSTESQTIANLSENVSHGEAGLTQREGTPGGLQPQPPKDRVFDKQGLKKLRVLSAGKERLASPAYSDVEPGGHGKSSKTSEKCTSSSSRQERREQPMTLLKKTEHHLTAEEHGFSAAKENSMAALTPAQSVSCSIRRGLPSDLQVWSSWESNEGLEPQLTLQEEVFTFSSQPHSPKRGQGHGDQQKMEIGDDQVQNKSRRRHEAKPEDDFIGSESDEDGNCTTFRHQRTCVESNPATPTALDPALNVLLEDHVQSHNMDQTSDELSATTARIQPPLSKRAGAAGMGPKRYLPPRARSPSGSVVANPVQSVNNSVSLSRKLLHEVQLDGFLHHKEEGEDETLRTAASSPDEFHLLGSLRMHEEDDEELQMLASLKREQEEEEECGSTGLSASQIHQCNVSISMSCDDASTWTHITLPANQGHHYQNEMNPLLHSNPREWIDVLSPPIMPPSQRRRSPSTQKNQENIVPGEDVFEKEEENEEEYLNLLYDSCLNCYFDPNTGKYYELA
ncbi:uncharacterized protein C3orf67 homolog isoform X2 [Betta splendens]|uniref:Uncharacterized protein C3orf67 homolog isoform X2 n=1 Tax=Betta splendens TaxID=158456 RepID=A0A6P7MIA0_BETSP|nr:uncharacterized protein C3orf67 homolog isoform X2 [Betta splendens]